MSTAAALIIGDEILTGKTQDQNTHMLAQLLFEQGVDLTRVVTILDDVETIANDVLSLSKVHDYVFTSGGIGPTHDDKTYEGVAKAFGRPLRLHEEALHQLLTNMQRYHPEHRVTEARKRMALLPDPCEVIWTPHLWVPLVVVENVYVLPGIPSLFSAMLTSARMHFKGTPKHRIQIFTQMSEGDIAEALWTTQQKFSDVAIGSYPKTSDVPYQVMVSFEGRDAAHVLQAAAEVQNAVNGFR